MTDETFIEAASVSIRTMADGTLRIACDVEPRSAQAAFALFGSPGTPMALVALRAGYAAPKAEPKPEAKGGMLSQWVALRCKEAEFQHWLNAESEDEAARIVREQCGVQSRAELDTDDKAAQRFHATIRGPYAKHCAARGVTTEAMR